MEEADRSELLDAEYDDSFTGDEKVSNLLKLTSDKFTRESKMIKIKEIAFTDPIKKGRQDTVSGLTKTIADLGVLQPIHVMTVEESSEDEDYKYILLDGLRRVYGAARNGLDEIDAVVWDFEDKDLASDLALYISLLLNRNQKRDWRETWHLYQILELQVSMTPGTLEYLLQLDAGDAMKLKDVMLCDYQEVKDNLLSGSKTLDACYKMLTKLRKEEDRLEMEDNIGVEDNDIENATAIVAESEAKPTLSDEDVKELLDMVSDLDEEMNVGEDDFDSMSKSTYGDEQQRVGDRHPLDPALRQGVLSRDNFTCKCCGMKLIGARLGLIAVHHILPVHCGGKDTLENLITLCVGCHLSLHIMERNGGTIMMDKTDYEKLSEPEKISLKKALKLARIAIDADKRKGLSRDDVNKVTAESIRHPMPGSGLKDNQLAYNYAKANEETEG